MIIHLGPSSIILTNMTNEFLKEVRKLFYTYFINAREPRCHPWTKPCDNITYSPKTTANTKERPVTATVQLKDIDTLKLGDVALSSAFF